MPLTVATDYSLPASVPQETKVILPRKFGRKKINLATITNAQMDALREKYDVDAATDFADYFSWVDPEA